MSYICIILFLGVLIFFILYPFKVTVYNENQYLIINIGNIISLKLNLLLLFDNSHNEEIKKQIKGLKVVKKIKIKEIDVNASGLNFDYRLNGGYFGIAYAILGFIDQLCLLNDISFNYNLKYQGEKKLKFKSVARARGSYVLAGFYSK